MLQFINDQNDMNALKETLLRLTKSVPERILRPSNIVVPPPQPQLQPQPQPQPPTTNTNANKCTANSSSSSNSSNTIITFTNDPPSIPYPITYRHIPYQQLFREFLEPLDMPNLKTFTTTTQQNKNDTTTTIGNLQLLSDSTATKNKYNEEEARRNWSKRKSTKVQDQLHVYFENRQIFHKMLRYLVEITPPHLKNIHSETYKHHILAQESLAQHQLYLPSTRFCNNYGSLPNLPQPLTQEQFTNYIHDLVHIRHHWQNASKLSGIIPQILLDSHKLTNYELAPYRSTMSYNHLMHYFGIIKNQSFLARALIVSMNRDGHGIDTLTINTMLSIVRQQSRIRSKANSLQLVLKYLHLANDAGVEVNLTTWSRIYDIVASPYLKQQFLDEMDHQKIPICDALYRKMIRDLKKL